MPTLSTIPILILAALTLPALAQSTDPRQVLEDSARAISEIEGFSAKAVLSGDGSAMIIETLPSMNARINVGTHPEHGKMLHMLGQLRATQKAEPETFDISYTPSKYIWTDHEKKTVNIYPPSVSVRVRPRAFSYNLFANLLDDAPFDSQLDNPKDIILEDNQTIAGQDCQVVYITRQDIKRGANASAHTHERWFISTADQLPRRLEQITDAGMIKATIIMELSDLTIAAQPESELMAFAPENYRVVDTTKKATPQPATQTPPTTRPANQQPPRPATPTDPPAPNFSFTDLSNTTITRSSQSGRITVLYFFGTWSIPSRDTTPLINDIAQSFADQDTIAVDTFAIAIRQGDPSELSYQHEQDPIAPSLTINPEPNLLSQFKVRVYPTIIVVDENSRIVFHEHLNDKTDASALVNKAKNAIRKALN